jgi:hypothetical protein
MMRLSSQEILPTRPLKHFTGFWTPTCVAAGPPQTDNGDRRMPLKLLFGALSVVAAGLLLYLALRPQPAPLPPPVIEAVPQPVLPAPVAEAPAESSTAPVDEVKPVEARASFRRRNENVIAAVPVRDGSVSLAIAPWGEVYVDGASRGVSPPLTHLSLPPGAHTIEIRNNTSPPFSVRVELKSGESIALQHRF